MGETMGPVDIRRILTLLPHRYPMLLVDRVESMVKDTSIHAVKAVTMNEPFFQGHFPGRPIMPGVLIVEALAQTAAVLMMYGQDTAGQFPVFAGIDRARFRRQVVPGDELLLELTAIQQRTGACKLRGVARVGAEVAAQVEIFAVLRTAD